MPRFVRPFWIEADVDGYKNDFKFGPNRTLGQFDMAISQRKGGDMSPDKLTITGMVTSDNKVVLVIKDGGRVVYKKETAL